MAGTTGLEPAASAVTGQRSNQLNYVPTRQRSNTRDALILDVSVAWCAPTRWERNARQTKFANV